MLEEPLFSRRGSSSMFGIHSAVYIYGAKFIDYIYVGV